MQKAYPVIDLAATGHNILRLRQQKGLTVRDLQKWFSFEEPRAIYKWQSGQSLPSVDNLYALSVLLDIPIEEILIPQNHTVSEPREAPAASFFCRRPIIPQCRKTGKEPSVPIPAVKETKIYPRRGHLAIRKQKMYGSPRPVRRA